jgi:peptide-methionine (S)-S-oxide reductase
MRSLSNCDDFGKRGLRASRFRARLHSQLFRYFIRMDQKTRIVVFGGGCFWCTEAVFEQLNGVLSVMPGYAGGSVADPTYEDVCTGETGHAEVIRIEYDPAQISFKDLLTVFFATHDPTTLNRQGADRGTEYRSIILYSTEDQKREAEAFIEDLNNCYPEGKQVVTELSPLTAFYPAEEYHREFYRNNWPAPYCQFVIDPKLAKLRSEFSPLLNSSRTNMTKKTGTVE